MQKQLPTIFKKMEGSACLTGFFSPANRLDAAAINAAEESHRVLLAAEQKKAEEKKEKEAEASRAAWERRKKASSGKKPEEKKKKSDPEDQIDSTSKVEKPVSKPDKRPPGYGGGRKTAAGTQLGDKSKK